MIGPPRFYLHDAAFWSLLRRRPRIVRRWRNFFQKKILRRRRNVDFEESSSPARQFDDVFSIARKQRATQYNFRLRITNSNLFSEENRRRHSFPKVYGFPGVYNNRLPSPAEKGRASPASPTIPTSGRLSRFSPFTPRRKSRDFPVSFVFFP